MVEMQEQVGNIWQYHDRGEWVGITTNGQRKSNDEAVMGAGIALQAAKRMPNLPAKLGARLKEYGNRVFVFKDLKVITFPTKYHWKHPSSIGLIQDSAWQLMVVLRKFEEIERVYMPRPGCGMGKLDWYAVRPVLARLFDGRIIILSQPREVTGGFSQENGTGSNGDSGPVETRPRADW